MQISQLNFTINHHYKDLNQMTLYKVQKIHPTGKDEVLTPEVFPSLLEPSVAKL